MKTALVTGASRGIGRAIAIKLAQNNYTLHLTCIHSIAELENLCAYLSETYHISCTAHRCDMSDYEQVLTLFSEIDSLDVLINNAGISYVGLLQDMSIDEWNQIISTNLGSLFHTCKPSISKLLHSDQPHIINISSIWGNVGASTEVAYSASKGGVNAFTKALAKELAPSNIPVNAIACGVIDTDMNSCFSPEDMENLKNEIPANRIGNPEEVASLVLLLLRSPSYMTGQIITIDGGYC